MLLPKNAFLIFAAILIQTAASSQQKGVSCIKALNFAGEYSVSHIVELCSDAEKLPLYYRAEVNMPVCDDTLCANVILTIYWDLAGNYKGFDTIPGFPLTKFDHIKFTPADYLKMDQILKNRNSMLRILSKEDLVDKSVKIKSKIVDAVTGATPATVKNATVEGAVYTSFTLWHFVNGAVKNQIANYTLGIYSDEVARRMLLSENYETQLFALRRWNDDDYNVHTDLLFQVIRQSVPLIKANAILKIPLPFENEEKNRRLIDLFPLLDDYSKSIFINRVITEKDVAEVFIPLIRSGKENFSEKQMEQIAAACRKFEIEDNGQFP